MQCEDLTHQVRDKEAIHAKMPQGREGHKGLGTGTAGHV